LATSLLLLAYAGCSVTPAPAWKSETRDAVDAFTAAYLSGNSKAAARYFQDARTTVSGTGRADLVARVELIRCGVGTAALDFDACAGVAAMLAELTEADRAYAAFLEGKASTAEAGKLPAQYQALAQAKDADSRVKALAGIKDPLSRLVAAGSLFKAGQLSPPGVAIAVDTASEQAWRHPLLAWLHVQAGLAEAAGDAATLKAVRKRIDLVSPPRKE
jgi:hypothetical protein